MHSFNRFQRAAPALVLALTLLAGCHRPAPSSTAVSTGAEGVARTFFEALLQGKWSTAYDALYTESKSRCSATQFAGLAQSYMRKVGFKPSGVSVSVSESGADAAAVATFRQTSETDHKQFKVGMAMHRTGAAWAMVLPKEFGK